MAIREIPSYTRQAIGNGDFFMNDGPRNQLRDEETGELRFERTWIVDRQVEYEDVGTIEFGERSAKQIAAALGWISKKRHLEQAEKITTLRAEKRELEDLVAKLKLSNEVLIEQMAEYFKWAEAVPTAEDEL